MDIPLQERRIAAMHRGSGPKNAHVHNWVSFDGFLLDAAACSGRDRDPWPSLRHRPRAAADTERAARSRTGRTTSWSTRQE
jgi:hypothetical protein